MEISLRETEVKAMDNEQLLPTALTPFPRSSTGPATKKFVKNFSDLYMPLSIPGAAVRRTPPRFSILKNRIRFEK